MPGEDERRLLSWSIPSLLYVAEVVLQSHSLGRVVIPALDEGVYLYAARLVTDGLVPYRDFSIAHPPFMIALAAAGLKLTDFDVPRFSFLYVLWVFSAVFPLWAIARRLSASRAAAAFGVVLLCISPVFAGLDARFFALRQGSTPFLAWGLAALLVLGRPLLGGVLLGLFSACVVTNGLLAAGILVAFTLWGGPEGRRLAGRDALVLWTSFAAVVLVMAAVVVVIPRGVENVVGIQLTRPRMPVGERLAGLVTRVVPQNPVLLVLGLAGAFLVRGRGRIVSLPPAAVLPMILVGTQSYYPHYLSIFAFPWAITAAILWDRLAGTMRARRLFVGGVLAAAIAATSLVPFVRTALPPESASFFRAVAALRQGPEPLLAYDPIYALYARKRLTMHYHVVDAQFFRPVGRNVDPDVFARLLAESGTVLIEPYFASLLTPERRHAVEERFRPVFVEPPQVVLVRR